MIALKQNNIGNFCHSDTSHGMIQEVMEHLTIACIF